MATTGDAPLNLTKPEAADVVSLPVINTNYDTINANAASVAATLATQTGQISTLNTAVGAGGAVVKATNIAGGTAKRIPIQSSSNNTTFIPESVVGQYLIGTSSPPYAAWADARPYKIESGFIPAANFTTGVSSTVTFTAGFTQNPIVVLTPVFAGMTTYLAASISSVPNTTGFIARLRTISSGSVVATPTGSAADVHWVAIQLTA